MHFRVKYKPTYDRGELLLRSILGFIYIIIPHFFILLFIGLAAGVLNFISFWVILFTGEYPESFFDFQVRFMRWGNRVGLSLSNLIDGYPAFGLDSEHPDVVFGVEYPTNLSRGTLLLKTFLGFFYVLLPHGIVLYLRFIATAVLQFLAFWSVLFTGEYPENWHRFNVGTARWQLRLNAFMYNMDQTYPDFTGHELPSEAEYFADKEEYADWH